MADSDIDSRSIFHRFDRANIRNLDQAVVVANSDQSEALCVSINGAD